MNYPKYLKFQIPESFEMENFEANILFFSKIFVIKKMKF